MRRREAVLADDSDEVPAELRRFRYDDWADEREPVPPGHESSDWPTWRDIRAYRRFVDAQRAWCVDHGRDYAETFHPEWAGWHSNGMRH